MANKLKTKPTNTNRYFKGLSLNEMDDVEQSVEYALEDPGGTFSMVSKEHSFKLSALSKTVKSISGDTKYIRKTIDKMNKKMDDLQYSSGSGNSPLVNTAAAAAVAAALRSIAASVAGLYATEVAKKIAINEIDKLRPSDKAGQKLPETVPVFKIGGGLGTELAQRAAQVAQEWLTKGVKKVWSGSDAGPSKSNTQIPSFLNLKGNTPSHRSRLPAVKAPGRQSKAPAMNMNVALAQFNTHAPLPERSRGFKELTPTERAQEIAKRLKGMSQLPGIMDGGFAPGGTGSVGIPNARGSLGRGTGRPNYPPGSTGGNYNGQPAAPVSKPGITAAEFRANEANPYTAGYQDSASIGQPGATGSGGAASSMTKDSKGRVLSTANTNMNPAQRAMLDTIAMGDATSGQNYWESPDYNTIVGGQKFNDYSDHPRVFGTSESTAAGRYQFTKTTWDDVVSRYNKQNPKNPIKNFSPANQDTAAMFLANERYAQNTGRDLQADLQSKDPNIAANIKKGLGGSGNATTWQIFQKKSESEIQSALNSNMKRNEGYASENAMAQAGAGSNPDKIIALASTGKINPNSVAVDNALKMKGLDEVNDRQQLQSYLATSGQGLDPSQLPWCANFVNASLAQAGIKGSESNAAGSFNTYGKGVTDPSAVQKGDIVVNQKTSGSTGMLGSHVYMATGAAYQNKQGKWVVDVVSGNTGPGARQRTVDTATVEVDKHTIRRPTEENYTPELVAALEQNKKETAIKTAAVTPKPAPPVNALMSGTNKYAEYRAEKDKQIDSPKLLERAKTYEMMDDINNPSRAFPTIKKKAPLPLTPGAEGKSDKIMPQTTEEIRKEHEEIKKRNRKALQSDPNSPSNNWRQVLDGTVKAPTFFPKVPDGARENLVPQIQRPVAAAVTPEKDWNQTIIDGANATAQAAMDAAQNATKSVYDWMAGQKAAAPAAANRIPQVAKNPPPLTNPPRTYHRATQTTNPTQKTTGSDSSKSFGTPVTDPSIYQQQDDFGAMP